MVLIAHATIILALSSCKKENTPTGGGYQYQPFTKDLVAGRWIKSCDPQYVHNSECSSEHQIYVDDFPGALNTQNLTCGCTIKVYLELDGKDIQINGSPIDFMGNKLQATVRDADITIIYKGSTLPFSFLRIKVVGN